MEVTAPAKWRIMYGILDFLGGLPLFLTAPLYRRWHMRWGASDHEVQAPLAGDELVPGASFNATRAITIQARPQDVWPWIVQMGYRRAGFYTYDIADNAGYPSADHVLDEYQHLAVGDWAFNMNSMFGLELAGGLGVGATCREAWRPDASHRSRVAPARCARLKRHRRLLAASDSSSLWSRSAAPAAWVVDRRHSRSLRPAS